MEQVIKPLKNCASSVGEMNRRQNDGSCNLGWLNPFTGLPVDTRVADTKYLDFLLKSEENRQVHALEMDKQRFIYDMRKELEDKKLENAMKREAGMEQRKLYREMAQNEIFENVEGFLCIETIFPNGEHVFSKPVINCPHMSAKRYCEINGTKEVVLISLDNDSSEIVLRDGMLNALEFTRQLESQGVAITVCRERRKIVAEMVFAYLMGRAIVKKMPLTCGWHCLAGEWNYVGEESDTLLGVLKERINDAK